MRRAFTLVELLVVVLIIGILTAVAVPMYQSAVDKTHWSTLLPTARALKNAEEAYLMANNVYTSNEEELDVGSTPGDATYDLQTQNHGDQYNVIKASSTRLPNVRLAQYLTDNAAFADQLHCEALTNNDRSNKLCEKLLQGSKMNNTDDGYTRYLLDGTVDKVTCGSMNGAWSTNKKTCYKDAQERCDAGKGTYAAGKCTYTSKDNITIDDGEECLGARWNSCNNVTLYGESTCHTQTVGCNNSTFNEGSMCTTQGAGSSSGSKCDGNTFDGAVCNGIGGGCSGTFTNESVCNGESTYACRNSTFSSGSKCVGNASLACFGTTIEDGAICEANGSQACRGVTVKAGGTLICNTEESTDNYGCGGTVAGKCIANTPSGCKNVSYVGNGCCEGPYCDNTSTNKSHKCS